ncbi:MAG: Eco57I restriction-modification methylase domain-containing protein [Yaniella sp.]|uniref:Eco57I restriction-modification methylase domain-containing protein n=1 Tax=Yaniella sp. TaxID=2773929 RepID=UPI002647F0CB|nr:Eco57I restriction-modification methylase domain-containing protein [Yaniella sp.]MDN6457475.1 Eco57I restriction-modification methylase domain-containing protein [Yaniella sp.]MDN6499532.1 Eco57I restriction-modification methylase domain-containing protein [Yaniella sp.]MDN6521410.1 Eco57I restriction-modification methylase domain-containing protein [Yaniella sp.]MDN6679097.1 Eco57I restriction-modification methylase domain-containing protein [Yaniella sp.]
MTKKFDVVIGNPPYQEEAEGTSTRDNPIYHLFMDAAYEVGEKVVLITPARFLFNAGQTPKSWNEKMLADPHLSVAFYTPDGNDLFPGADIKGGIAVTYRDSSRKSEPIGTFSQHAEINSILNKVHDQQDGSLASSVSSSSAYRWTQAMHDDHPDATAVMSKSSQFKVNTNAFDQLPFLFHHEKPTDEKQYLKLLGLIKNRREYRWVLARYIQGPPSLSAFKVAVAKANGAGRFGEILSTPLVLGPSSGTTQSFITIGNFRSYHEAEGCLRYVKSKFARAMLSVLKTTQDNPARVWKHVPLQDFTNDSDIKWTRPIPEIDQQLYAKYGLNDEEIEFIETRVKPMN